MIQCPFTTGALSSIAQEKMEEHEKDLRQHLHMMMSVVQLKPPQEPPATVSVTADKSEYLYSMPPVWFTIADFTKEKECNTE